MCGKDNHEDSNRRELLANSDARSIHQNVKSTKRRGILQKTLGMVAGSLLTGFGFSKRSMAIDSSNRKAAKAAAREYKSEARIRGALESHASDLLQGLADEGYIDRPSPKALPLDSFAYSPSEWGEIESGVFVTASPLSDNPSAKIEIKRQLNDGRELRIVVVPDADTSQARLHSNDSVTALTTEYNSTGDVTLQYCYRCDTNYKCSEDCGPDGQCFCSKIAVTTCEYSDGTCGEGCDSTSDSCCGTYDCNL